MGRLSHRSFACAGLSVAYAPSSCHLILNGIIAVNSLDTGMGPFHFVPEGKIEGIPLIPQGGELDLWVSDPCFDRLFLCDLVVQDPVGEITEYDRGADLLPGGGNALRPRKHVDRI